MHGSVASAWTVCLALVGAQYMWGDPQEEGRGRSPVVQLTREKHGDSSVHIGSPTRTQGEVQLLLTETQVQCGHPLGIFASYPVRMSRCTRKDVGWT